MKQLKTKKHKTFSNTYVVNAYGKEFHISKYYENDADFKGEWNISEYSNGSFEWIDTVYSKGYALIRIQQLYGEA